MFYTREFTNHSHISIIKRQLLTLILTALFALLLTGCGKEDPKLTEYKEAMSDFAVRIHGIVNNIEAIDVDDDSRAEYLLDYLDEMDEVFSEMAAIPVPEQFESIEELADEASANLSRAVSLYHQAFDGEAEGYDFSVVSAAQEYYSRAFLRLSYIGTILQGEVPDGENIEVIYDDGQNNEPSITETTGTPDTEEGADGDTPPEEEAPADDVDSDTE